MGRDWETGGNRKAREGTRWWAGMRVRRQAYPVVVRVDELHVDLAVVGVGRVRVNNVDRRLLDADQQAAIRERRDGHRALEAGGQQLLRKVRRQGAGWNQAAQRTEHQQ